MQYEIPHPPDAGLVNAIRFGTDPFRFLEGMQARFEDIASVPIPGRGPLVIVTNPSLIHEALSRPDAFHRIPAREPAALIAEQGLVQSEKDLWHQQRSIMSPAFQGQQVKAYANTVGEAVDKLVAEWKASGSGPETRNLHQEMTALTIRVASEILLGEDLGRENAEQFHEWMQIAGAEFEFSPTSIRPNWIPQRISPEFRRAAKGIHGLSQEIIDRRRTTLADTQESDHPPRDMLALLLKAEDDPSVTYPEHQIRDEVATFLIAGHETTALSLTYTLSLLAQHPPVRDRVREEANSIFGDKQPRYEHVSELMYTNHVYREGLRLYPPAWAVFRQTSENVHLW